MNSDKRNTIVQIIESSLVSIAASFPVVGSLAAGWTEYKNIKQAKNIHEILTEYAYRLSKLEGKVDTEYLKTEDAKKLIEQTVNVGKDETRQTMRSSLSTFLTNASTYKLSNDPEKFMILETISKISPLQIKLLVTITKNLIYYEGMEHVLLGVDYNNDKHQIKFISENDLIKSQQHLASKYDIEASLDYMLSIGIIETGTPRYLTSSGDRGFRPNKLGIKTLEYLGYYLKDAPVEKKIK